MTIALDASTPAFVKGTTNPATTASFSPPAGSLIIAFAESDESNTFSISNSGGLTFTSLNSVSVAGRNSLQSWWAYAATAPGSMTISSTKTGSFTANALKVVVFTGTETSFTGAHNVAQSNTLTLTGTQTGSWMWAAIGDNIGSTTDTAGAGCTYNDAESSFGGVSGGILKRTSQDGVFGSGTTLSAGSASTNMSIVAVEVKASSGASTVNASASLSGTSTLTASATETTFAAATLSESSTLSASVGATLLATAALSESATISATAVPTKLPNSTLGESATLIASARVTALPQAPLAETATLSASPNVTYFVNTVLSETASLSADLTPTTPPATPATPYIPPTPPNAAAVDEWRAFIFETVSGTYETELPLAAIPTYQYTLNDAGSGSVQIALGGTDGFDKTLLNQYADNEDWRWSIAVVYNNAILQAGPIVSESYSEGATTSLSFSGIWKLFSRRVIINPSADISAPTQPAANSVYTNVSLNQLAKMLVQDNMLSQGALPIDLPADDLPGTTSQTYYGYDLHLVADELSNLTKLDQGPEIEFRPYWVDPLHVRWVMRIGRPRLGQLGSAWVYDYGEQGALVAVDKTSDSSNNASASYSRGAGSQASQVIGYAASSSAIDADLLLLAVDDSHTSETSQSKLSSYARASINSFQHPVVTYALTVKMNGTDVNKLPTSAPTIDQLSLGDTVQAAVTRHHRLTDGVYTVRVVSIQNGDSQTAKLTTQTTTS